jgi:acyl-CoA synthetase (NDP forming)
VIVGVTRDPSFGSLVLFGMGGVQAELLRDTALRIVPLTDVDASEMIRSLRTSPLLFGFRGAAPVDAAALEGVLLRVGLLAEHVPEIAELDCNPVVVSARGVTVVDVKVRLAPVPPGPPPGVRRLRDA